MDRRFADPARRRASGNSAARVAERTRPRHSTLSHWRSMVQHRLGLAIGAVAIAAIALGAVNLRDGAEAAPQADLASAAAQATVPADPLKHVEHEVAFHDDSIIQDLEGLEIPQIDPDGLMLLGDCDSAGPQPLGPNGRLPASALCTVNGIPVRADAAEALARMNQAFVNEFGRDMCLGNGYRGFDQQAAMHRDRPHLVAPPGQSNHGLGLAVDFCGNNQVRGTAEYTWMLQNAETYGWVLPSWAQPGGSRPEPWHWEYVGIGRIGG